MKNLKTILSIMSIALITLFVLFCTINVHSNDMAQRVVPDTIKENSKQAFASIGVSESVSSAQSIPHTASRKLNKQAMSRGQRGEPDVMRRHIIYKGDVKLQCEIGMITRTISKIEDDVTSLRGRISSSNVHKSQYTATYKIPVEKFRDFIALVKTRADTTSVYISSEDVTEKYQDLLSELQATNKTYQAFVKILEEKANTVDDILKTRREMDTFLKRLDVLKGKLKYLSSKTEMSTITITLVEKTALSEPSQWKKWYPTKIVNKALSWQYGLLLHVMDFVLYLIVFLPLILIVVGLVGSFFFVVDKIEQRLRAAKQRD